MVVVSAFAVAAAVAVTLADFCFLYVDLGLIPWTEAPDFSCSAKIFDVSQVRAVEMAWSIVSVGPMSKSFSCTSLSFRPNRNWSSICSASQRLQHVSNSHFLAKSRSSHNQLSMESPSRCVHDLNCWRHTRLFFPALHLSLRYSMIWAMSSIAVFPRPALTTAFRVFGDMQDSSTVAKYFGCCGGGTRSLMVDRSTKILH